MLGDSCDSTAIIPTLLLIGIHQSVLLNFNFVPSDEHAFYF